MESCVFDKDKVWNQPLNLPVSQDYSENYETDSEFTDTQEKMDSKVYKLSEMNNKSQKYNQNKQINKTHSSLPKRTNSSNKSKLPQYSTTTTTTSTQSKFNHLSSKKLHNLNKSVSSGLIEMWESNQLALADANSLIVQLNKQLKECKLELKTLQRQYKMQAVRLDKAIGQEADMPQIVDRLTAEVRTLQIRLREKTTQSSTDQRKISELYHRIYILEKMYDERQSQSQYCDDGSSVSRKRSNKTGDLSNELEEEKKKNLKLKHELAVLTKNYKQQINITDEKLRCLRQRCQNLENSLQQKTQQLQEKSKLLELQNVYSHRIPRSAIHPSHLPTTYTTGDEEDNDGHMMKYVNDKSLPSNKYPNVAATASGGSGRGCILPKLSINSFKDNNDFTRKGRKEDTRNQETVDISLSSQTVEEIKTPKLKSKSTQLELHQMVNETRQNLSDSFGMHSKNKKLNCELATPSHSMDEHISDENKENSCNELSHINSINGDNIQLNKENKIATYTETVKLSQHFEQEYTPLITSENEVPIDTCKSVHEKEILNPVPINLQYNKYGLTERGSVNTEETGHRDNQENNRKDDSIDLKQKEITDTHEEEKRHKLHLLQVLQQVDKEEEEKAKQKQCLNPPNSNSHQLPGSANLTKTTSFGKAREEELWNDLFGPKKDKNTEVESTTDSHKGHNGEDIPIIHSETNNHINETNNHNNNQLKSLPSNDSSWLSSNRTMKQRSGFNGINRPNTFTFISSKNDVERKHFDNQQNLRKQLINVTSHINAYDDSELEELQI
ncbi:unnamed protein product [Heterobilharzia americana]|nr:unnamed protein product [Heterobilharzia americana]